MFEFILNIPVRSTKLKPPELIHRIIGNHKAKSLEEITQELQSRDYIIVDELYPNEQGVFESHGPLALNHRYIGKIKEWSPK
jgi:hypothetical protein